MFTEFKISAADVNARSLEVARTLAKSAPGRNPAQFAAETIAARLKARPAQYLEFGPYWWAVKGALARLGHDLGQASDAIILAEYGGDLHPFAALVAGEMFKDDYRATWFAGNAQFWLDAEASESYVLFDMDMQARVLGQDLASLEGSVQAGDSLADGMVVVDSVEADVPVPKTPFRVEFERAAELWTADIYAGGKDEAQRRLDEMERTGRLDSAIHLGRSVCGEPVIDHAGGFSLHVDVASRHVFEVGPPAAT